MPEHGLSGTFTLPEVTVPLPGDQSIPALGPLPFELVQGGGGDLVQEEDEVIPFNAGVFTIAPGGSTNVVWGAAGAATLARFIISDPVTAGRLRARMGSNTLTTATTTLSLRVDGGAAIASVTWAPGDIAEKTVAVPAIAASTVVVLEWSVSAGGAGAVGLLWGGLRLRM